MNHPPPSSNGASNPDVVVVGAGIGGLSTAVWLASNGCRVRVIEAAEELREVGAGVTLGPNATRVLRAGGVLEALIEDDSIEVVVNKGQNLNEIFAALTARGIDVVSMRNKANRLEELFMRLVEGRDMATGLPGPAADA